MALRTLEDISGNADKQEEEFVVADVVDIIVDVDTVKVDEVEEETGAHRRESSMRFRLGYASVKSGKGVVEERCVMI